MKKPSKGILVDTCIWVEFFKSYSDVGNKLELLIESNSVWVCGVVLFELVQGVKSKTEKSKILNILSLDDQVFRI